MAIIILAIIVIGGRLFKEWLDDIEVREHAKRIGLNYYASSTGLRYVDDNKPYGSRKGK